MLCIPDVHPIAGDVGMFRHKKNASFDNGTHASSSSSFPIKSAFFPIKIAIKIIKGVYSMFTPIYPHLRHGQKLDD